MNEKRSSGTHIVSITTLLVSGETLLSKPREPLIYTSPPLAFWTRKVPPARWRVGGMRRFD